MAHDDGYNTCFLTQPTIYTYIGFNLLLLYIMYMSVMDTTRFRLR